MHTLTKLSYYPLSLKEIEDKVAKKINRRNSHLNGKICIPFCDNSNNNIREITNEFNEKIFRIDGKIPINLDVNNNDRFLFISYDQSILTHGLHKYPAKFFPELPRWLINRYSKKGDLILVAA
jgi:hypothetical protein